MIDERFQHSNFAEIFGRPLETHRIKRSLFQMLVIPAILFLLFLGGVIAYRETRDIWALPFCALPFGLLFVGVLWHLWTTRRDELRIYEHGFTYKNRKNLYACLWSEIDHCRIRHRNEFEIGQLPDDIHPLGAVEKKNGESIEFDHDLPGTPAITRLYNGWKNQPRGTKEPKPKRRKKRSDQT